MNKRRGRVLLSYAVVTVLGELVAPAISADNPQRPTVIVTPAVAYSMIASDTRLEDVAVKHPGLAAALEANLTTFPGTDGGHAVPIAKRATPARSADVPQGPLALDQRAAVHSRLSAAHGGPGSGPGAAQVTIGIPNPHEDTRLQTLSVGSSAGVAAGPQGPIVLDPQAATHSKISVSRLPCAASAAREAIMLADALSQKAQATAPSPEHWNELQHDILRYTSKKTVIRYIHAGVRQDLRRLADRLLSEGDERGRTVEGILSALGDIRRRLSETQTEGSDAQVVSPIPRPPRRADVASPLAPPGIGSGHPASEHAEPTIFGAGASGPHPHLAKAIAEHLSAAQPGWARESERSAVSTTHAWNAFIATAERHIILAAKIRLAQRASANTASPAAPYDGLPAEYEEIVVCPNSFMFGEWLRHVHGHIVRLRMRGSDGVHEDEFQIIEKLVNRMARSQYDFRDCLKDAVDRWRLPDTVEVSTLERLEILDSCIGSMISSDTQIILERGRTEEAPIELTAPVGIALPKQSAETANQLRENLIRHCEEARRTEPTEGPACFFEDIRLYLAHALGTDQISMADAQRLGVLMVESYRDKIRSMEDPFTDPPESPTQRAARQAECVQKFREYAREIRGILGEG